MGTEERVKRQKEKQNRNWLWKPSSLVMGVKVGEDVSQGDGEE